MPIRALVSSLVVLLSFAAVSPVFAQQRVRVGGEVKEPKKIKDVKPVYPKEAQDAGVQGIVIIEALIGTDGVVKEAKVIRGVQMLDAAALEAVMQWRYTPTVLNGDPVELIMTVTVTFTLTAAAPAPAGSSSLVARFEAPKDAVNAVPMPEGAVRVGGAIKAPRKVKSVAPTFPEGQREATKDGLIVILEIRVGPDGRVTQAKVLRPAPAIVATIDTQGKVTSTRPAAQNAFVEAAVDAVKQWEYEPTLLNGAPVSIVMTVTVTFRATIDGMTRLVNDMNGD